MHHSGTKRHSGSHDMCSVTGLDGPHSVCDPKQGVRLFAACEQTPISLVNKNKWMIQTCGCSHSTAEIQTAAPRAATACDGFHSHTAHTLVHPCTRRSILLRTVSSSNCLHSHKEIWLFSLLTRFLFLLTAFSLSSFSCFSPPFSFSLTGSCRFLLRLLSDNESSFLFSLSHLLLPLSCFISLLLNPSFRNMFPFNLMYAVILYVPAPVSWDIPGLLPFSDRATKNTITGSMLSA